MNTYVVPMFAVVEAETAEEAMDKAHNATTPQRTGGLPIYTDETLDPFAFDPELHQPMSVEDRAEIEIK